MIDTRYDQMLAQAKAYHLKHPDVWKLFVRFTLQKINQGWDHYSAKGVFERIRWETNVPDVDTKKHFKLGNNYHSFYARFFMNAYPQHQGFFRLREQTSMGRPARRGPEKGPEDLPYVPNDPTVTLGGDNATAI